MGSTVIQEYGGSLYMEISRGKNRLCQYLVQVLCDGLFSKSPHSRVTLDLISMFQRYAGHDITERAQS